MALETKSRTKVELASTLVDMICGNMVIVMFPVCCKRFRVNLSSGQMSQGFQRLRSKCQYCLVDEMFASRMLDRRVFDV
jgi:hypothetical protein